MNEGGGLRAPLGSQPVWPRPGPAGRGRQMPEHLTCYTIKEIIDAPDLGV